MHFSRFFSANISVIVSVLRSLFLYVQKQKLGFGPNFHRIFRYSAKENVKLCAFPATAVMRQLERLMKTNSSQVRCRRDDIIKKRQSTVIINTKPKEKV